MIATAQTRCFIVFQLVCCVCTAFAQSDDSQPRRLLLVDEPPLACKIEQVGPDWSVVVKSATARREISASSYVRWGKFTEQTRSPQLLLAGGTTLVGEIVRIEDSSLTVASRLWGRIAIDRDKVAGFLLQPPADASKRDRRWWHLRASSDEDRILLQNGDELTGTLQATSESSAGLFGLVSVAVGFADREGRATINFDQLEAIVFRHLSMPDRAASCLVGFQDGTIIHAAELNQVEQDRLQLVTTSGTRLVLEAENFLNQLCFLQPSSSRVTYVSDLTPLAYKSVPLLDLDWPLGIDTNCLGDRLRSESRLHFKGIGMHSTSRVVFDLDRKYDKLQAELALDDQAGRQGSVVYRVLVERKGEANASTWSVDFTSPIVRGDDKPIALSLDVSDATRIALLVEMADRGDVRDYANWLDARLIGREMDR